MDKYLSPNSTNGSLHLIIGPMFAGKSSELMKTIKRLQIAKRNCLVINYNQDNRYSKESVISTHDKIHMDAVKCGNLSEIKDQAYNYDVIGIDEGQFFDDVDKVAVELADAGKIVIIAALDGSFTRECFGSIHKLLSQSETITKLTAICIHCQHEACFTRRKIHDNSIKLIGSQDIYEPVCRGCYVRLNKQDELQQQKEAKLKNKQLQTQQDDSLSNSSQDQCQDIDSPKLKNLNISSIDSSAEKNKVELN